MYILNEDLFDELELNNQENSNASIPNVESDVVSETEIKPDGPDIGLDTGIANLIHDLIIDENEAIQQYNGAAVNMEKYPELQKLMHDLAGEEFIHVGELQKALEMLSPNAANIAEGEVESEELIKDIDAGSPVDESLTEDTEKKSNGKWVNKGADGEHGEFKTKKAADAQRKAMFANGFKEEYQKEFTCKNCGNKFILRDQYMGACDCPECGQWYNIFGQQLKNPKYWFDDEEDYFDESLNISDDFKALKLIDKTIKMSEITKSLPVDQREQLADEINDALHSISRDRFKK